MYRDPLEGVRARIQSLDAEIAALAARFSPSYLRSLPKDRAALLASLRAATEAPRGATQGSLRAAEEALAAYRDALEDAVALAPELFAWLDEIPSEVPDLAPLRDPNRRRFDQAVASFIVEQRMTELAELVTKSLAAIDPRATLVRLGTFAYRARLRSQGVTFSLTAEMLYEGQQNIDPTLRLGTTVRRGLPRIDLAPEMWRHAFTKAIGMQTDRPTGDFSFDGRFLVDVDAAEDVAALGDEVRAALLKVAYYDVPKLHVEEGLATLQLCFDAERKPIEAAIEALIALRKSALSLVLPSDSPG